MPTAALKTLGCKLNQFESEQMREQLQRLGYTVVPPDSPADLFIINSCTVTHQADRDARRLARRAKRLNPHACVVVTGCYAEMSAAELEAIPEIDLVCGMEAKGRIGEIVRARGLSPRARTAGAEGADPDSAGVQPGSAPDATRDRPLEGRLLEDRPLHLLHEFADHTRGFVKAQEGCNARCSYCIIPGARGPSRSVPFAEVVAQTEALAASGHPEIVLIGTHLGQFGRDLPEPTDLVALVRRLLEIPALQRLRLSSIEPREVTDELIAMLAGSAPSAPAVRARGDRPLRLCRYLHIPLQSGCDSVLRRMNRPYDAAFYADLLQRVHAAEPAAGLGADVIVGFPGETDEEFEQTRALVERLPLAHLHVFTYSPRQGTPAATMPAPVPHPVALARNHILRDLGENKRQAFAERMVGQMLGVVLQTEGEGGILRGVTDNYLTLTVSAPGELLHRLVPCEVTAAEGGALSGRLL